jgi:nitrite reductase/ring-hydroxylating ferredoxin subunit
MMSKTEPNEPSLLPGPAADHDCAGCALTHGRRDFLQSVSAALGAIALSLVGRPLHAGELAVRYAGAISATAKSASYPIPTEDGATIDEEREVILVRWKGAVYAFALYCPHKRTALKWKAGDARFQCPKHKSRYQPDGTFIDGKATRGMDRYAVSKRGRTVVLDLTKLYREDEQRAQWTAAVVRI